MKLLFYKLNNGLIIPTPARPVSKEKRPRPITTIPADLKKTDAYFDWANDTELNDNNANTGNVPNVNANISNAPCKKEPLESAENCIDWVKPQGKKNVPTPIKIGDIVACSIFLK